MVLGRLRDSLFGPPTLTGPTVLPPYFPVTPAGCEKHAERLFTCIATTATEKARDMEKAGYAKSYYPDIREKQERETKEQNVPVPSPVLEGRKDVDTAALPSPNDNPLDQCRTFVAYYKRCCDRELKKKKNWILTEPYRVQEEYRYKKTEG
ncbi:hypothetical protein ACHAW6_010384 [Cyclotella cf. meneghiniana]